MFVEDGTVVFRIDETAVENVLMKLARGHVAFEASKPQLSKPSHFCYKPVHLMSEQKRMLFFRAGSRYLS